MRIHVLKFGYLYPQIEFDDLPWLSKKSPRQKLAWWERSRRLQHGTLVCLWVEKPDPKLFFGVIAQRKVEHLAQNDGRRPIIGIR